MWRRVACSVVPDVSKDPTAFVFYCFILKVMLLFSENSVTTGPLTERHLPQHGHMQQYRRVQLKYRSIVWYHSSITN